MPGFFHRGAAERTRLPVDVSHTDGNTRSTLASRLFNLSALRLFFLVEAPDDIAAGLFVGFEVHESAGGRFLEEAVEGTKTIV